MILLSANTGTVSGNRKAAQAAEAAGNPPVRFFSDENRIEGETGFFPVEDDGLNLGKCDKPHSPGSLSLRPEQTERNIELRRSSRGRHSWDARAPFVSIVLSSSSGAKDTTAETTGKS